MRILPVLALCALSACMQAPGPAPQASAGADVSRTRVDETVSTKGAAPVPVFAPMAASSASRSNTEIAADFLALEFRMESGRALPVFTRFEGPITVALKGAVPPSAPGDLGRLINRFRNEAGLNITQTTDSAHITVEFIPRSTIRSTYANVACFVVPRVSSWDEYRAVKGSAQTDWTTLTTRERVAIFAPADSSPQEIRDCLHEEIAQAMGPLNDLYQLPDSVFNDDNFHTVLTGFDMLVLRLHYSGALRSGMTKTQVAQALPGLLAQMNPAGQRAGTPAPDGTPRAWINAMERALGPSRGAGAKQSAAQTALGIAMAQGWRDSRMAFSYFAVGRMNMATDPSAAIAAFDTAGRIYRNLPGGRIHAAHVDMQMAVLSLGQGDANAALSYADRAIPVVRAGENASLLATLLMVKAEALELLGRDVEADSLRLDSMAWARYGFGSDTAVRDRMRAVANLAKVGFKG